MSFLIQSGSRCIPLGNKLPLWALESQDPVRNFDMVAFTVGYEMSYSNILNMLDLAGIPLRSSERHDLKNIVFFHSFVNYYY